MKKTILLFATVFIFIPGYTQLNFGLGVGAGISKITKPSVQVDLGYDFNILTVNGGYAVNLSSKVEGGALFYGLVGKRILASERLSFTPSFGYSWLIKSAERKELNVERVLYGLEAGLDTNNPQIRLTSSFITTGKNTFINLGFRFVFGQERLNNRYCN